MTTVRRAVLLALVAGTALPALTAVAAPASVTCPGMRTTPDGWRRAGAPTANAYAVRPDDPDVLLTTDGSSVSRSGDGGCTWAKTFTIPAMPSAGYPFGPSSKVVAIAAGSRVAYAAVSDYAATRVVTSRDGGKSWTTASGVMPNPFTGLVKLATDLGGETAYLLGHPGIGSSALYATSDSGDTWALRPTANTASIENTYLYDVAVDPLAPANVWVGTDIGVYGSTDGGTKWSATSVGSWTPEVTVTHRPGRRVAVAAASGYDNLAYLSVGSDDFVPINTPSPVLSLAGGLEPTDLAISTKTGVYELNYDALTWSVSHSGAAVLGGLTTDYAAAPAYHGCVCNGLAASVWSRIARHRTGSADPNARRGTADPYNPNTGFPGYYGCGPSRRPLHPPAFPASSITPAGNEIDLAVGQSVTVPYRFAVQPRELDVFYLLDTGPRSDLFGCAEKQAAVWSAESLARQRNLRVGVGEYRDYNLGQDVFDFLIENCTHTVTQDFVYRRDRQLGPVNNVFRDQVGRLDWGGNCTDDHAGLAALQQLATGAGQDLPPLGPSPYDTRSGQQAGFRPPAVKVVAHVAGSWFESPSRTPGYPGPDQQTVVDTLNAQGIHQVGIYVPGTYAKMHEETHPSTLGRDDLRGMATATDAVARHTVDCVRGDRVPPGEPLVCGWDYDQSIPGRPPKVPTMGKQIANLVADFADVEPMALTVLAGDAAVTRLTPGARAYDWMAPHTLAYSVTYRCGADELGRTKQVQLAGTVGTQAVATATTTVRCGAPAPVPFRPRAVFVPPPPLPVHLAAPAGNPVPNPNPAPNPATQPQAQTQSMPQGAAVPQEQAQPQVAYAVDTTQQTGAEYAMTGLNRGRRGPPGALLAQGMAVVVCGLVLAPAYVRLVRSTSR